MQKIVSVVLLFALWQGIGNKPACAADQEFTDYSIYSEFAVDAGLWAGTYAMESLWYQASGLRQFPTERLDFSVRDSLHGKTVDDEYNVRERSWRQYSDSGIAGLVVGAIATPFATKNNTVSSLIKVSRAFAVNNFLCTFLKNAVHRSRPKPTLSAAVEQNADNAKSFPSSHASNAMVAASSIAFLTPEAPLAFHSLVYTVGASIGVARIMADRHFFSDVLIGSAIGVGITTWTFKRQSENQLISFTGNSLTLKIKF